MPSEIDQLVALITDRNRMQKNFIQASLQTMTDSDHGLFAHYLEYCRSRKMSLESLADSYNLFVRETMKEQVYFCRHKKYRFSSRQEVEDLVYYNPAYMEQYMYGLAISTFLWPNHRRMGRFFEATLPRDARGVYLEVGPGHGFYLMRAMRLTRFDKYEAVDLSPSSVEVTRSLIGAQTFAEPKNYDIRIADFLTITEDRHFEALILGEVLEHVEHPLAFLKKVACMADTDSYIYISTCLNAPEIDHISLFSSMEQLRGLIQSAGLRICEQLLLPYAGTTLEEAEEQALAVNVAMTLRKV